MHTPSGFIDLELGNGEIKDGQWRSQIQEDGCLRSLNIRKDGRRKIVSNELCEDLKTFLNSELGSVPWQLDYVGYAGKVATQDNE